MDKSQLFIQNNLNNKIIYTNKQSWDQFLLQSSFLSSQSFMTFFLILIVLFYRIAQNYQRT